MSPANEKCNLPRVDRAPCPNDYDKSGVERAATRREWVPSTYLDWCYHLSTEWTLWCLLGNISQDDDQKTRNTSQVLPRIDSGVDINLLGQDVGHTSSPAALAPPTPIALTFYFEDGRATKQISYSTFSKWSAVNSLFSELARDGIVIDELWDVNEDMQIGSGDWDGRIQPGSAIEAWCFNDERSDDWEADSSDSEVEEETEEDKLGSHNKMSRRGQLTDARNEHTWWFTRWRQRVEKAMPGRDEVTDEPSWFMIVVWCTITIGIVIIVTVLSL